MTRVLSCTLSLATTTVIVSVISNYILLYSLYLAYGTTTSGLYIGIDRPEIMTTQLVDGNVSQRHQQVGFGEVGLYFNELKNDS